MDTQMSHSDLPRALVLFKEMNVSVKHVTNLVDNMILKVRSGEITTNQGLSFLEMKYNMLLSYLINLTYVVLQKSSGKKIEGDPCIDNLIEIRTVLEKIKPIDSKLKYQIDKLVKNSIMGNSSNDLTSLKANPTNLLVGSDDENNSEYYDSKEKGAGVYVPPKLSAVHFTDESARERNKRQQSKSKKLALSSSIMQDLREEYLEAPVEVTQSDRAQQIISKQQMERQEYEEEYLTRLPITRSEKHARKQTTTLGTLGEEIINFTSTSFRHNKKRKSKGKSKKNFKRKCLRR